MKHRIGHRAGTLFLALVAAGCGSPERPPDPTGSPVLRLARRIGPDAFPVSPPPLGRAVATIDDDTRAVIEEPKTRSAFSALGLSPEAGALRTTIGAESSADELAPGTLTLRVQSYPARMPAALWPQMAETMPSKRVASGFRLSSRTDGTSELIFEPAAPLDERSLYNVHVDTLLPGSALIESLPFDLPEGGSIEFEYGLTTNTAADGFVPVRFGARLQCADEEALVLADETLGGSENPGWRPVSSPARATTAECRIALSAVRRGDRPAPGAVFSVPRVVAPRASADADVNLIVISLDTLRADHLSGYGYPRATSPRIDAELIARGAAFTDVSTTYVRTDVSHMSLFTGLYGEARPDPRRMHAETAVPLLAERLRDAGYETAAFTEDGLIAGSLGFWWGFDRFVEFTPEEVAHGASTFEEATRYLRANRDRRFFLFVHTYKTHSPYASADAYQALFADPNEWDEPQMQRGIKPNGRAVADAYDRTIREADDLVADLLQELAAQDLEGRTIVALLSDHGESLTEHGPPGHSYSTYQEVVRVPLVLRGPGIPAGLVVDTPVSLVDVTPTLLELTGLAPLEVSQGISLVPALRGLALPEDRALFFSSLAEDSLGVRRGDLKYLGTKPRARFDLAADPMERRRLRRARFPDAEKLLADHRASSARLRERFLATTPDDAPEVVSEETENALRALGYLE